MALEAKVDQLIRQGGGDSTGTLPADFDLDAVIGFEPRALQAKIASEERRFNVEVLHRRFGKTYMKLRKLMHHAIHCPHEMGRYAYLAPSYAEAEDIAWAYLLDWAERIYQHLGLDSYGWVNRRLLYVLLPTYNGSPARIRIYGTDSPKQRLRGRYLDGVVLDEYAQMRPSVWFEQIRPSLSDANRAGQDALGRPNQWADFIFTPKGRNAAYHQFKRAEAFYHGQPVREQDPDTGKVEEQFSDQWYACRWPASETHVLSKGELREAEIEMGRSRFRQEYEVEFDAGTVGTIYAAEIEWLHRQSRVTHIPVSPLAPVHTGWDLGWDDATAIWFAQIIDGELRVVDFYEASNQPLHHYAQVLGQKGYTYGKHFFPHDVEQHELGTGQARSAILRQLGVIPTSIPSHRVADRIAATQATLPICRFSDTTCQDGLDRLMLYRREYDETKMVMRDNPLHDWTSHAADAFGMLVLGAQSRLRRSVRGDGSNQQNFAEM